MKLSGILFFSFLFWLKVANQSHLSLTPITIRAPDSVRDHSYRLYSYRFPAYANVRCLPILLMLSGDIALNPGPVNLGFVNSRSIRNKGSLIGDTIVSNNLDILALAETHIQLSDTDSLLKSVTPPRFRLSHKPRMTGHGGGVGFLTKELPTKVVDAPTYSTFENVVTSVANLSKSFVVACVYHTPGSYSSAFLDDFLFFCGFLSSLTPSFVIFGDFNIHVDTDCINQQKFLNLLDISNLLQSVNKPTHLLGHILDLILSQSDSNFISAVTVGDLISDHTLVKCHLDFACSVLLKVSSISYCRYHKIDMQKCSDGLANTSFVLSPASNATDLYDQYVHDLHCLRDRHAPLICGRIKKEPAGWLSDAYCKAKSVRHQFERMWRKDRSQLSRDRLHRQIALCKANINRDKLNTTALSSMTTAVSQRSYGRHYDKFLIRVTK